MALIKCPECGKEVSDTARTCPNCGYKIKKNISNEKRDRFLLRNKKIIAFVLAGLLVVITLSKINSASSKEYCNGIKWGTSLETIEKKYPDILGDNGDYYDYFHSFDGYTSSNSSIDVHFYFDEDNKLCKIEVSQVGDDIDNMIIYYVDKFNKVYHSNQEPQYNGEYTWTGRKSNVTIDTTNIVCTVTYEKAE